MFSALQCVLGIILLSACVARSEPVKIDETLQRFLGALERYTLTPNGVVFLLDESGSIGADKFPQVKLFTELIVRRLSVSPEHSRIAIVTFATEPRTHVDQIEDSYGNNMCTLIKKIEAIDYAAEWTHTSKAMNAAKDILSKARKESNKIIILITDGQSNDGYSPVEISQQLKSEGVIIFAVGVASVNVEEVEAVATSLDHVYILDSFDYIQTINKYLKEETKEVSWDYVKNSSLCSSFCSNNDINCCDYHANCYCGTRGGNYECACNSGYYGSGHRNGCHLCPKGTYKSEPGNHVCSACPEHSTTLNEGSSSFQDCACQFGYERQGDKCEPVLCAKLEAPHGGILIPLQCGNSFGEKCTFKCNEGFCPYSCSSADADREAGILPWHLLPQQSRTCLDTGKWSGEGFHCEKVRCAALEHPVYGSHDCSESDFTFGTKCNFHCDKGYELLGSASRECHLNGSWTGLDVKCKVVSCEPLKTNKKLFVKPKKCGQEAMPYRSVCQYYCAEGYNLTSQHNVTDGTNECLSDKTWSKRKYKISCVDISPPSLKCPDSIERVTDLGKSTALIAWKVPTATDNVYVSSLKVKLPVGIGKPPHAFPIGTTKVVYEAVDSSNHSSTCSFNVKVIDKEPPSVLSCPEDIEVYNDKKNAISVTWTEPVFTDNSGELKPPVSNRKNGFEFAWGPSNEVHYTATDPSGNVASCNFTVKVKPYPCPYFEPPANGVLTCDAWQDGRMCSVFCKEGFEFAANRNVPRVYLCHQKTSRGKKQGVWGPFPSPGSNPMHFKMPWPDCSRMQKLNGLNVGFEMNYIVDFCDDKVVEKMKHKFVKDLKLLDKQLNLKGMMCRVDKGCTPENVNITCGISSLRKRRSVSHTTLNYRQSENYIRSRRQIMTPTLLVSFNIELHANKSDTKVDETDLGVPDAHIIREQIMHNSVPLLKDVEQHVTESVRDAYNVTSLPPPEVNFQVVLTCSAGQVRIDNSCMNCPAGTFKDDLLETCVECPIATFQSEESSLSCLPCPKGSTTYHNKSKSLEDCKAPCQPGTYSRTTFEPCLSCPLNTYQQYSGRKECLKCPRGLQTWRAKSNSSSDCVSPCKAGSYSDTGFEPCNLCSIGHYQDESQMDSCTACPNRTRTPVEGSISVSDCREINMCVNYNPCSNMSTCLPIENSYKCICPDGLQGTHCEVMVDGCTPDPCFNKGRCVMTVHGGICECPDGFTGGQCETNIDDCEPGICLNGGECKDLVKGYECICPAGYTGQRCETNIFDCASSPCHNGGTCFDMRNSFRCCCAPGYSGHNCDTKLDDALVKDPCANVICQNGGSCFSSQNEFNCSCLSGFTGQLCEVKTDDDCNCCSNGTCRNGGGNETCECPDMTTESPTEQAKLQEYSLSFLHPTTSDYVEMKNARLLYAITVSFFMRTSYKDEKSRATPVSYSYFDKQNDVLVDNALTLLDINRIVLYLHGEILHTGYTANSDSDWHHYAVTWGKQDGKWSFYVDGNLIVNGSNVGEDKYIWPGVFILGQEQDSLGGTFSTSEAFVGDINGFNVWDYDLPIHDIKRIASSCGFAGNLISWFTALNHIYGNLAVSTDVTVCSDVGACPVDSCYCVYSNNTSDNSCKHVVQQCSPSSCANEQPCLSDGQKMYCTCNEGFEGRRCEYDINECLLNNGGCSHVCLNDLGSHHCACPEDMILTAEGFSCRERNFCLVDQQIFMNGETWSSSCENCSCVQGEVLCQNLECPQIRCHDEEHLILLPGQCCPVCMSWSFCLISPNNTVGKFDLSMFEFSDECSYTLVEDCVKGQFRVEFEPVKNRSVEDRLVIYHDCMNIRISETGVVHIDNELVQLPFKNEAVSVHLNTTSVDVWTYSGLYVQWYLTGEIAIAVPDETSSQMCGLCGNFQKHNSYRTLTNDSTGEITLEERTCYIRQEEHQDFINVVASHQASLSHMFGVKLPIPMLCLFFIIHSINSLFLSVN